MTKSTRGSIQLATTTTLTVIVLIVFIIAILIFFSWIGTYLKASVFNQSIAHTYYPLIRHESEGAFCYDNNNDICNTSENSKNVSLGYLPLRMSDDIEGRALFSCTTTNVKGVSESAISFNREACDKNARIYQIGFVLQTPNIKTTTPLYKCIEKNYNQKLLTDDQLECDGQIERLGYVFTSGHAQQKRLDKLCLEAKKRCQYINQTPFCLARKKMCDSPY